MKQFIFLTVSFLTSNLLSAQSTYNTLWSWGDNSMGQLGYGYASTGIELTNINQDTNWSTMTAGHQFAIAIKKNGSLWSWGKNNLGQLGQGNTTTINIPQQIGTDVNWKAISSGESHTVALKSNGTIWTWGHNFNGQLGQGNTTSLNSPKQLGNDSNWKSISSGEYYTLAVKNDGTLWGWGRNGMGQLGLGNQSQYYTTPQKIGTDTNWSKVFAGNNSTAAIKNDGTLWMWGYNGNYILGTGSQQIIFSTPQKVSNDTNWHEISVGYTHVLALKKNGSLWAWGSNNYGKLGLSNGQNVYGSPQQVGNDTTWSNISISNLSSDHSIALKKDGTIWCWGVNNYGQLGLGTPSYTTISSPQKLNNHSNSLKIISSSDFSLIIKNDGTLWSMGENSNGQLGRTFYSTEKKQIEIDTNWLQISNKDGGHSVGLKKNGSIWSWGDNSYGQLGLGNTTSTKSPKKIGNDSNWSIISSSHSHTLAIKKNGTLWAWGYNNNGQLGIGNTINQSSPVQVGTDSTWKNVFVGKFVSAGIKKDGTLWIWGTNSNGNLGLGNNTNNFNTPQKLGNDTNWSQISFGSFHTLATKRNGTMWAWGAETNGQLGLGQSSFYNSPQQIGNDSNWIFVSASDYHSIAKKSNGTIWSWGYNNKGQLGLGNSTQYNTPQKIGNDSDWKIIVAGINSTFAIKNDSTLWAWGNNEYGQLGVGNNTNYNTPNKIGSDSNWIIIQAGNNYSIGLVKFQPKPIQVTLCKPTNHIKLTTFDTLTACISQKLTSKNKSYVKYRWSTGDSSISTIVSKSGLITLRETDSKGCVNIDTVYVRILKDEISQASDTFLCNVRTKDTLKLSLSQWFKNAHVSYFDQSRKPVNSANYFIKESFNRTWNGFASPISSPSLKCPIKGNINASVLYPRLVSKTTDTLKIAGTSINPAVTDAKYNKYRWSTGDTTKNISLQNSGNYWFAHYWNATINGVGRYCYQMDSFHLSRINLITPTRITAKLGSKIVIKVKDSLNTNSSVTWSNGNSGWSTVYTVTKNTDTLYATQSDAYRSITKFIVITGRLEPNRQDQYENEIINYQNDGTEIRNNTANAQKINSEKLLRSDSLNSSSIQIFPNPVSDVLFIEGIDCDNSNSNQLINCHYEIFNSAGQLVQKGNISRTISVANLITGSYTLKIGNSSYKFIKK